MTRPAQARLDLAALRHNVGVARTLAPRSQIMAVVKANAYGHGAVIIASALQGAVDALAVACLEEAMELRYAGIDTPILLLEGAFSAVDLVTASQLNLWVTVENDQQLRWLEEAALPLPLNCWLKVNTGMNRLGVAPADALPIYQRLRAATHACADIVISTHFACADDVQNPGTLQQLKVFNALPIDAPRSAANSAAVLAWPESHYHWVRPGYMLYGNSPMLADHANARALLPVMTLASAVISLRDVTTGDAVGYGGTWVAQRPSRIATVAIGYGDGYPRSAPNGTPVLVNGQRATLAGRVSMDMITVDVTDLAGVELGAQVVLWGVGLPQAEVAQCANSLGYELTTRMPARTPRIIVNA